MAAYYNEFDKGAAAWLRELIRRDLIAPGDVDERSIEDVRPDELRGYTQHHFFAGIGGWSYALRLAGWPDDRPVWTGSCPCQPFSTAGQGAGFADERHLWPAWQHLIAQCRPASVFGEQVASKDADPWLDLVQADLEGMGYAFGCVPFPSAGVGAPNIRDRNYWCGVGLADTDHARLEGRQGTGERAAECVAGPRGVAGGLAYADSRERDGVAVLRGPECDGQDPGRSEGRSSVAACGDPEWLADSDGERRGEARSGGVPRGQAERDECRGDTFRLAATGGMGNPGSSRRQPQPPIIRINGEGVGSPWGEQVPGIEAGNHVFDEQPATGPLHGFWRDADWLLCRDGKWRPVEPGTFPLADGIPARVVRLRGYGNAINPHQAAEFIRAYLDCHPPC